MYMLHIIFIFNTIFVFKFASKSTLTRFKFFFSVFKTNTGNLINSVLIKIRLNISGDYFTVLTFSFFFQQYFIHCTTNNSIITLLPVIFLSWYRIVPAVLRGLILTYLKPKSPRTLHSYDECPGICMRQVFDSPFRWSTHIFLRLPVLSLIAE